MMKLLLDQNISFRVAIKIQDIFSGTKQVRDLNLENLKDAVIWNYARDHGYCMLTFDSDFYDIGLIKGSPPKIIWMRIGNTKTRNIEKVLRKNYKIIKSFHSDPVYTEADCLEINH